MRFRTTSLSWPLGRAAGVFLAATMLTALSLPAVADQLDKIRAQNITNEADRNKALNELDKQAVIARIDAQIAELKRLGQDTTNAEALRAETITFYANRETQIRRDANKKALGEAQKKAQDALQVIQDEEELKIART